MYGIIVIVLTIGHHVFRIFIEADDKSLNWLNNKLRFGGGSRFMELPVLALLFLFLRTNKLRKQIADAFKTKPWFSTSFNMLEIKKV